MDGSSTISDVEVVDPLGGRHREGLCGVVMLTLDVSAGYPRVCIIENLLCAEANS